MGSPASTMLAQFANNSLAPLQNNPNTPDVQALQAQGYQEGARQDVTGQPSSAGSYLTMTPAQMIAQSIGRSQYGHDASGVRDPLQVLGDSTNSFFTGLFTTPLEMANMPIQAVSPTAGAAVNRFIQNDMINNAEDKKSSELTDRGRAYAARSGISSEINRQQEDEDLSHGDSALTASLKRIGRDFLSSVHNMDSSLMVDSGANALGSIATLGPMEKGAALLGRAALRGAMDTGAVGFGGARTALRIGDKVAAPAIIGGQQAAGIDQSTAANIANMSSEELAANSQSYRDAIDAGMSDKAARDVVASNAGLTAGALAFPGAAVAGELRVPFVRAPFNPGSAGEAIKNILKSGADGAIFGIDGTLAANKANQLYANPDQDMEAGVGESAGQGAIVGLGMTAATQGPGLAGHAVSNAAGKVINKIGGGLQSRGQAKIDALDAKTAAKFNDAQQGLMQAINTPEVRDHLNNAVQNAAPAEGEYVQNILNRAQLQEGDLNHPIPAIQEALQANGGATDKFDALHRVAAIAADKNASNMDRVSAAQYLLDNLRKNADVLESPSRAIESLPEGHEALPHLRALESVVANTLDHPEIKKAIAAAQKFEVTAQQVDPSTPEGQQALHNAIKIAEHRPEDADPDTSRKVLDLNEKGVVSLDPKQKTALETSVQLAETHTARQTLAQKLGLNPEKVSRDITMEKAGEGERPVSAIDHVKGVMNAMMEGNHELAKQRLARLGKFADHMQNKVTALNEHFETANGDKANKRPYQQLNERTGRFNKAESRFHLSIDPREVGGIKFANALHSDANTVHEHYNMLARAYPELGLKEKTLSPIHPELRNGTVEEIAKKFDQRKKAGLPSFDPSWERLTKFSGDASKEEAQASEGSNSDAKTDTSPASQESASKADVESASAPKAPTEEKVPAAEEKKPQTRLEHSRERAAELAKAKPGELKVADAFPADLREKSEEGLKHFGYRSQDGKQLIRGKYHVDGDTIENLDIGDTNNKTQLGVGETRNLYKQIVAENPGVKWIHGYRITGGRVTDEHVWFEVTDKGLKSHGQNDPRSEMGTDETVQAAEATPTSEETAPGSDQEATTPEESQLTIGSDSQGQSNKSSIAKHFPYLFSNVAKKVINWFAHGFNIPEKPISRLVGLESAPSEHILNAIQSQTDAEKFIGDKLGKRLLPEVTEGFSHLFELAGPALEEMNNRLQAQLNKALSKAANSPTIQEALINGNGDYDAVNIFRRLKTLNLIQENEKGELEYNATLQESAILAGLHWLVTQDQKGQQYDQESLAEMLGIDQAEAVDYLDFFNGGHYTSDAVDALRQTIEQFWGVKAKNDIPQGLNRGISEAMAKEVIMGLKAAGLIEAKDPNQLVKETGKQYSRLVLKVPTEDRQMIKSFPDILGRLVMTDHEPIQHIGKPPEKINTWQMGFDKLVKITGKQKRTVEANQQQPYYLNTNRIETMLSMGKKQFVQLMGYPIHDEMNVNDRKSKESYNTTVEAAYDYLDGLKSQLQAQAEKGQDIGEIPVHFEWRVSRVGRFHAQGRQNPQSSKFVRMMLTPNRAELDLKTPEHRNIFQLAVAQHLGLKIENLGVNRSIEQITSDIPAKYPESFKIVQDWAAKDPTKPFKLTPDQAAVFDREFGDKLTPEVLHALPEYARFLAHSSDKSFVTDLPIETDGKTDGPGHALMHLVSGGFSAKWLEMMSKVGFYAGSDGPKTIADHVNSGLGSSSLDLYGTASNILSQIARRKLNAEQPRNLYDQRIHLFTTLRAAFGSDFNFDEEAGKLQIERGVTKNPMTTYIYGAGLDGIASKIGAEVVKKFYEAISNDKVDPRVLEALHALTHHIGIEGGNGRSWLKKVELKENNPIRPTKDFTFTGEQLKNINENIKNLFIKDMQASIEHTLTGISSASEHLRDAVQAQSIFLEAAIRKAWADKIAEKKAADPKWNSSIGLSQAEMDQIRNEQTAKWHGVIESPTGNLFPAGAGNAELTDGQNAVELSAGFNDELRTSVRAEAPGNAGVRALPYSVISQDGNVIQNMFNGSRTIDRALPVHDGINVSLDRAIEDNQTINGAVLKSWLGGEPLANASRAFNKFLEVVAKEGVPDSFTPKQQEDLQRALGLDSLHPDVIKNALIRKGRDLDRVSRENRAMKNVLEKVNLSIDHMAGTESPHVVDNKINITGDFEEQSKQLHEMYLQELDKLKPSSEVKEHISKELQALGTFNENTGVRTISVDELKSAKLNLRRDIMDVFHHALDAFKGNIHIGDRDSLLSMANDDPTTKANAWYDPYTNDIYLAKNALTGEILTHELIHAATRVKAFQFFNDPSQLSEIEQQAFSRIERLRQQWMKNPDIHGEDLKSYNHLMKVMADETDPSSALNEFMAYALTEQKLIDTGKATRVKGRLATVLVRVAKEIQRVLFGNRELSRPQKDLFSNLKLNTHIIMQAQINDGHPTATTVLNVSAHQSQAFGGDDRVTGLRKLYGRHMSNLIERADSKFDKSEAATRNNEALEKATLLATKIRAEAFPEMTPQERSTFTTMVAAFHTAAKLDPNALARVQTLFSHVIKHLSVEDFMKNPETGDEADRLQAHKKLEALSGQIELISDEKGRSSLLPVFLALANTNEQFRDILTKMDVPKVERSNNDFTLDRHLENAGIDAMDMLEKATSGERLSDKNVRDALDSLTYHIGKQAIDDQNFMTHFSGALGGAANKANDWLVNNIDRASNTVVDKLDQLKTKTDNRYANYAIEFGKLVAAIGSKDRSGELQEGLTDMVNRLQPFKTLAEIIHEVIGRTTSNAGVVDLIKVAKTTVSQLRQKFREHLPVILGDKFSQKLTEEQWNHLHKALLQTDIASLHERYSKEGLMDLFKDPSKARAEIKMIEAEIRKVQPENADTLLRKTAQLSRWMNTHKVEDNFLRNAHAIARLHGEREERQAKPTDEIVQKIDHLASLYALDSLDKDTKATLSELAQKDTDAIQYSLDYLIGQRKDEVAKAMTSDLSQMNHFKGYIPTENHEGHSLRVMNDSEMTKMLQMGYVRVGDYKGSAAEVGPSRGYYLAEGSGKSPFMEGVLQNVRGTAYGVDSRTGFAHGPMTAGRITDAEAVKKITRARMLNRSAAEPLMPIRDNDGQIVAYERSIDPEQEARVKKVARLDKTIGQWRGRQAEELAAHEVNRKLIDALYDMYHGEGRGISKEPKNYVNILDPREQKRDPIVADAARLITNEVRASIEDRFGPGKFMIRRDLINNAIGYRQASVGDLWTGETRWSKETQDAFVKTVTGIFGTNAYKWLKKAENTTQDVVTDWKATIVVRSMVVLAGNVKSDYFQLMSRGMNPITIAKGYVKKATEIHNYVNSLIKLNEIEADMRAATDRPDKLQLLQTSRKAILDAQKRMSIWPLIESGQYSIVSNMGVGSDDSWKTLKSLDAMVERAVHKLPEPLQTTARYYTVARDTALFKVLERATEYSDFLGRAVLYDHLTEAKKMSHEDAVAEVASDFINYDYLPGRTRSYLESMGLTWFWNYKLRAAKVAVSILRNNPVHMFLSGLASHNSVVGSLGTPMRDNFITATADGRLMHSIGPISGFESAGSLNPWNNLFGIWIPDI